MQPKVDLKHISCSNHVDYHQWFVYKWLNQTGLEYQNGVINVYSATNIGIVRDHNEDDLLTLHSGDQPTGTDAVLVVADGMGGHLSLIHI